MHKRSFATVHKVACGDCNLARICIPSGMQPDTVENLSDLVRRNRTLR